MFRLSRRMIRSFLHKKATYTPTLFPLRHSFSVSKPSQVASPLVKILEQEIQYEKENTPSSEALLGSIRKQGWEVHAKDTMIQMVKKVGDKTINVVFHVEAPNPQEEVGDNEEVEKMQGFGQYTQFTVYVQKPNSPKIMYADFLCNKQETRIVNLNFTQDYNAHKMIPKHDRPLTTYQGPDVYTLEPKLLTNLTEYFNQLGVNIEVASFIQEYSKNSEHPLYIDWLQDLQQFIK